MNKLKNFLKKIGIIRSASYSVKGEASKLAEIHASDGGMIQSQKEINAENAKNKKEESSVIHKGLLAKKGIDRTRILFWIFVVIALFFLLTFLGGGFTFKAFVTIAIWIVFLIFLWNGKGRWTASLATVLIIGIVLVFVSLFFVDSSDEGNTNNEQSQFTIKDIAGKISGIAAISEIQKGEYKGKYFAAYHFLLNDKIKENHCQSNIEDRPNCENEIFDYTYTAILKDAPIKNGEPYIGHLTDVYCNKGLIPTKDLFKSHQEEYQYTVCNDNDIAWANRTEVFYSIIMPIFDNYEDFLKINTLIVYDATRSWKPYEDSRAASHYLDDLDSIKVENEYRSYQFELKILHN